MDKNQKKPNQIITTILWLFFKPFLKLRYNFIYDNNAIKDLKGPAIILGNHASALDVFLMGVSAFPISLNYVAGYAWFRYPILGFILKQLKAIPKFQYQIDLNSVKEMINVIKSNKVLGLFPTGRLSSAGVGIPINNNVAKLIKKLEVPVYFFRIDGAYLSAPKWGKNHRKGRIEAKYTLLFDKHQIKDLEISKITDKINSFIVYDDYQWNQEKNIDFKGKNLAEKLEKVLFICPKCNQEHSLHSKGNKLECSCGFNVILKANGNFEKNQFFTNPRDWHNYQKQLLAKQYKSKTLSILDEAIVEVSTPQDSKFTKFGVGHVTLINQDLVFKGKLNNEFKELIIDLSKVPSLPFRAGKNFEVSYDDRIFRFTLSNGNNTAKWSLAVEAINEVNSSEK